MNRCRNHGPRAPRVSRGLAAGVNRQRPPMRGSELSLRGKALIGGRLPMLTTRSCVRSRAHGNHEQQGHDILDQRGREGRPSDGPKPRAGPRSIRVPSTGGCLPLGGTFWWAPGGLRREDVDEMPGSCRSSPSTCGRAEPTAEVSCLAAQLGCQLYGGELVRPCVAGRPPCAGLRVMRRHRCSSRLRSRASQRTAAVTPGASACLHCGGRRTIFSNSATHRDGSARA